MLLKEMLASVCSYNIVSWRPLLTDSSLIPAPCLLSNPSKPPRDPFSSQGLPSISPLFLSLSMPLPHSFSLSGVFLSLISKLTNEEDKEQGGRGASGSRRRGAGGGGVEGKERDRELIRLEKHAGLNTLLMSTTKDSSCVSGVREGCYA